MEGQIELVEAEVVRTAALPGAIVEKPDLPRVPQYDETAAIIGSWPFIIIQSCLLAAWVTLNVIAWIRHWDPYPFILLNLALSFQAAYAGPFILMSQNRQQDIDRRKAETDYQVNVKAELEIELLHEKLDALKEQELADLARAVRNLSEQLEARRG